MTETQGSSQPTAVPRLAPVPSELWTDEMRERIMSFAEDGKPLNIHLTFINHPAVHECWSTFGRKLGKASSLTRRERELVILRTAYRCQSDYEYGQHVHRGLAAGLTSAEIGRTAAALDAVDWSDRDRTLLRAIDELHDPGVISDATWAGVGKYWSTQQVMDIVFLVGMYTMTAMALRSFGVQRDEGIPGFPSS